MKNKMYVILVILLSFIITSYKAKIENLDINHSITSNTEEKMVEETIEEIKIDHMEEKLLKMSLDEKLGQLLIIGIENKSVNETTKKMIEKYKVGGFIFFARNIEDRIQLNNLTNDLKYLNRNNPSDLFISIDEEGGRVSRLSSEYMKLPEAKLIGDLDNPEVSYEYGQLLGNRLNTVGINLNFAPVLDINSNPKNPVIGNRSFGNSAEVVINNGIQVLKGIQSKGVIGAVKHFPGHGDTSIDSHINLPSVNKSRKELESLELLPFRKAIEEDVDMIMVAHILFPELDPIHPATMSKHILTELLRKDLGFNGVVISDDMTMGAIIENYTLEFAVLEFLKAGGDIALVCHGEKNPPLIIDFLKDSLIKGDITIEQIDHKVYRILTLKEKYNLIDSEQVLSIEELDNITNKFLNKLK